MGMVSAGYNVVPYLVDNASAALLICSDFLKLGFFLVVITEIFPAFPI